MHAWTSPEDAFLATRAETPSLFDSRLGRVVPLPAEESAGLYVCGITPYDATHMGHAATYVAFDLLNRAWRDAGSEVHYVQNVTDVDDPLLERAEATGVDWRELAREQTDLFRADMEALGVYPPEHYVGATEAVDWLVPWIEKMLAEGTAYTVPGFVGEDGTVHPDGDVYFDVRAARDTADDPARWYLGYESGYTEEEMRPLFAERGGDPERPGKKDPFDPLLWRAHREGEPAWDGGTLGAGRPGWHIECSVIAQRHLGAPYTVQGGGSDLRFPHHEMSAGHTFAVTGERMAEHYVHTGMVGLDGEKMSKSKGNLVLVSTLRREGVDPRAVRLAILANHYRADWFWTEELLDAARSRLRAWTEALDAVRAARREDAGAAGADTGASERLVEKVRTALGQDLDAPTALAAVDAWARAAVADPQSAGDPETVGVLVRSRLGVGL